MTSKSKTTQPTRPVQPRQKRLAQFESEFAAGTPITAAWIQGLAQAANSLHQATQDAVQNGNVKKIRNLQSPSERLSMLLTGVSRRRQQLIAEMDRLVVLLHKSRQDDETVEAFLRRICTEHQDVLEASVTEGESLEVDRENPLVQVVSLLTICEQSQPLRNWPVTYTGLIGRLRQDRELLVRKRTS